MSDHERGRPAAGVVAAMVAVAVAVAGLLLGVSGCARGAAAQDAGGRLRVVATTPVVADFVRNIGGDRVFVTQILKPNVDPHDYEPSPADIQSLAMAEVVVENGVGLESWLSGMIANSGFKGLRVDASKGVPLRQLGGQPDPHIWHDPRNAEIMVRNIAAALRGRDPADEAEFTANLAAYTTKLTALDRQIAASIDTIPPADRKLVTNHDAFGYYVARYRLRFVGAVIPSFDSSAELSARDIDRIVSRIEDTDTKAVFSETSLPPRTARTIADEAGVQVVAGEDSLYGDSLGPQGSAGETYLAMEQHNTEMIVSALS